MTPAPGAPPPTLTAPPVAVGSAGPSSPSGLARSCHTLIAAPPTATPPTVHHAQRGARLSVSVSATVSPHDLQVAE
jgi:hypothetical protein